MISADLAALGEENRRDPLPLERSLHAAGVYRDDGGLGAAARRDELLDQRRHELAFMPLTYAHVFAHRVGRAAAGGASILCAVTLMFALGDPLVSTLLGVASPSVDPSGIAALAVISVLVTYIGASWIGERVFESRMRKAIALAGDVHADLDRLAEGPVDVARKLVHRVDSWAVAYMVGGVIAVAALLGFTTFAVDAHAGPWHHWTRFALQHDLGIVIYALAIGGALVIAVGRACARRSRWLRWLAHGGALAAGMVLAGVTVYQGLLARLLLRTPSTAVRLELAIAGVVGVFLIASYALLWWRDREQRRLNR